MLNIIHNIVLAPFQTPSSDVTREDITKLLVYVKELSEKGARRKAKTRILETKLATLEKTVANLQSQMTTGLDDVKGMIKSTNEDVADLRSNARTELETQLEAIRKRYDSSIGTMGELYCGVVDYIVEKNGGVGAKGNEKLVEYFTNSLELTSFIDEVSLVTFFAKIFV